MAISYVGQVGSLDNNFVSPSADITVGAGGIAAGSFCCMAICHTTQAATISVTDAKGNVWTADARKQTAGANTVVILFSAYITNALVSGDYIRIAASSAAGVKAVIDCFTGVKSSGAIDKTSVAENTISVAPTTSGLTATTAQADELLYGAFAVESTGTRWTISNSFTETADADSTFSRAILAGYKIVSATGTYEFASAASHASQVVAAIATYMAGVTVDKVLPDADLATTGWTTTPLFSKINDSSDATVITSTAV